MTLCDNISSDNEFIRPRHCWLNPFDCSNERLIILLIGMRAVGKTYLGNIMNKWYMLDFIDMDEHFSTTQQCTISDYVTKNGWDDFRNQEIAQLSHVLDLNHSVKTPNTSPLIIACGGGIISTDAGRVFVSTLKNSPKIIIIHVKRENMSDWTLSIPEAKVSTHRPYISAPSELWKQRRQYYHDLSHGEYIIKSNIKIEWNLATNFMDYINLLQRRPLQLQSKSHFIQTKPKHIYYCLSLGSQLYQIDINDLLSGIDALEYRADLMIDDLSIADDSVLWNHLDEFKHTISCSLPLCFSLRSTKHGGKYHASSQSAKFILKQAIGFGCSWVDLEWDTLNETDMKELLIMCHDKRVIPIISYHGYIIHEHHWASIYESISSFINMINAEHNLGTILIKIVSLCDTDEAIASYFSWSRNDRKDFISHCVGNGGRETRVHSSCYSPLVFLTVPCSESTAFGQYTIKELNQAKAKCGHIQSKFFYLFGSHIQHSLSPIMHNTAFTSLGLPFSYNKYDVSHAFQTTLKITDGDHVQSSFGGASITSPLKQSISTHLSNFTGPIKCPCASATNVVNTLISFEQDTIFMANTDWIALFHLLQNQILSVCRSFCRTTSFKPYHDAILLGLGATAHSSMFALDRMLIPPSRVLLWNRTKDSIPSFIKDCNIHDTNAILSSLDTIAERYTTGASNHEIFHVSIISSLPLESDAITDDLIVLLIHYITVMYERSNSNIFITLVEWNYAGSSSRLHTTLKQALLSLGNNIPISHISGKDLLLEQAIYQSYYWTGMTPPRSIMKQAME